MKCMLLGAGGTLGRQLLRTRPDDVAVSAFTHAQLDVTREADVADAIAAAQPDWILNTAAYTAVDRAEREEAVAARVNAEAPGHIGRVAARVGARVLHLSTDYVFDGNSPRPYRENDAPAPINAYGRGKLAGERRLANSGARALIVRTQWLFDDTGPSFPALMLERARAALPTRAVSDQTGCPTYAPDLASAIWRLVALDATGILHVANSGCATRYELARRIFDHVGAGHLVSPCATADFPTPARRPLQSALDTSRAAALLGQPLPLWSDALERWFEHRGTRKGEPGTV